MVTVELEGVRFIGGRKKFQIPSPRLQRNPKLQASRTFERIAACRRAGTSPVKPADIFRKALILTALVLGIWSFSGAWNLGFGGWTPRRLQEPRRFQVPAVLLAAAPKKCVPPLAAWAVAAGMLWPNNSRIYLPSVSLVGP